MSDIIPVFSTCHSIGRSLFTLEDAEDIKDNSPISIFSVAKKHDLKEIYLRDNSFSGFIQFYKGCEKHKVQGMFGISLVVCANMDDKNEESFKTESKVTVWLKNSKGYGAICKIFSKSACDGFYYCPRIDWKTLKKMWDKNLLLSVNFYDGVIHTNLLQRGQCIPEFPVAPVFCIENHELPFDFLIENATKKYCENNNLKTLNIHSCYYYKDLDSLSYFVYRIATSRRENSKTSINKPEIEYGASDKFSFEEYLRKANG